MTRSYGKVLFFPLFVRRETQIKSTWTLLLKRFAKFYESNNTSYYQGDKLSPALFVAYKLNNLSRLQYLSKLEYPEILPLGIYLILPHEQDD